jgi:hypothetical protein
MRKIILMGIIQASAAGFTGSLQSGLYLATVADKNGDKSAQN